jgi:hypothetical protein
VGNNEIGDNKNEDKLLAISIAMAMQWYDVAQCLIEHVQGFTGSYWMPPLGKCLRRIAPVAVMVNQFVETTQNTNKTQLLA